MTPMETRTLGQSGLRVSAIGLGCNNFGGMDSGITLFDTADSYGSDGGSEIELGKALGRRRADVVLATKFASPMGGRARGDYDGSRRYVMQAVEHSLRRLQTDYIDLYQYHFPDPHTPIDETLRALEDLIRAGKLRYVGCSNLTAWQLVDAGWTARHHGLNRFVSTQAEYNLLDQASAEALFPAMDRFGMGLLPYFPLASGLLTGKYRKGTPPPKGSRLAELAFFRDGLTDSRLDRVEALIAFAEDQGRSLLDLAFAWLLGQPRVASVIAGATTAEQVRANAAASDWRLTPDQMARVNALIADSRDG